MPDLECRFPLDGIAVAGTFGAVGSGEPRLRMGERRGLALCQLMARRGRAKDLAARFAIGGAPGVATPSRTFTALPLGPGEWMLVAATGRNGAFCRTVAERAADLGYASEQSHGRAVIRLAGPAARDVLMKGCRLDLHPRIVGPGFCAQSPIAGIGVLLHQVDIEPTYELIVASGFAESFWQWLTHASAEFGYRVDVGDACGLAR